MTTETTPSTPPAARPEDSDAPETIREWYAFAAAGVVSFVVGVLVLAYPDPSVELLGVFIGIDLLVVAVAAIVRGVSGLANEGSNQGTLLVGIVGLIAGALVIRNPGGTVVLLAVTLAIYLIVAGALALSHAIISSERRLASLVKGLALAGAGTVMLCWPDPSLDALVVLAGLSLCIQGVVDLVEAFLLRALRRQPG
jgi:uncharacterized membrane protein HdeD (DUF308 family)